MPAGAGPYSPKLQFTRDDLCLLRRGPILAGKRRSDRAALIKATVAIRAAFCAPSHGFSGAPGCARFLPVQGAWGHEYRWDAAGHGGADRWRRSKARRMSSPLPPLDWPPRPNFAAARPRGSTSVPRWPYPARFCSGPCDNRRWRRSRLLALEGMGSAAKARERFREAAAEAGFFALISTEKGGPKAGAYRQVRPCRTSGA